MATQDPANHAASCEPASEGRSPEQAPERSAQQVASLGRDKFTETTGLDGNVFDQLFSNGDEVQPYSHCCINICTASG